MEEPFKIPNIPNSLDSKELYEFTTMPNHSLWMNSTNMNLPSHLLTNFHQTHPSFHSHNMHHFLNNNLNHYYLNHHLSISNSNPNVDQNLKNFNPTCNPNYNPNYNPNMPHSPLNSTNNPACNPIYNPIYNPMFNPFINFYFDATYNIDQKSSIININSTTQILQNFLMRPLSSNEKPNRKNPSFGVIIDLYLKSKIRNKKSKSKPAKYQINLKKNEKLISSGICSEELCGFILDRKYLTKKPTKN
ncbi:hypothetical protein M0811_03232 [Anaeramoeba ignava]|uniref:Uncharacterized protein n=1 Tax=Anaeramoeba ignava TaxID=1746090 RepID=A0A9Q0L6G0_ANAIG|nr:hypothetical protein M0811_03232 [Anaeramoeba ignava]